MRQGNSHDAQAGVQANEVLRAKKKKRMFTDQNTLQYTLGIVNCCCDCVYNEKSDN